MKPEGKINGNIVKVRETNLAIKFPPVLGAECAVQPLVAALVAFSSKILNSYPTFFFKLMRQPRVDSLDKGGLSEFFKVEFLTKDINVQEF